MNLKLKQTTPKIAQQFSINNYKTTNSSRP